MVYAGMHFTFFLNIFLAIGMSLESRCCTIVRQGKACSYTSSLQQEPSVPFSLESCISPLFKLLKAYPPLLLRSAWINCATKSRMKTMIKMILLQSACPPDNIAFSTHPCFDLRAQLISVVSLSVFAHIMAGNVERKEFDKSKFEGKPIVWIMGKDIIFQHK